MTITPPGNEGQIPARPLEPHRGTLILVLGILSLVCCGLFTGIPAWILGSGDLKKINAGLMDPAGKGLTNAGFITGIIGTCLSGLAIIINIIVALAGAGQGFFGMPFGR